MEGQQPGQTISPQSQQEESRPAVQQPQTTSPAPVVVQAAPTPEAPSEPASRWKFLGDIGNQAPEAASPEPSPTSQALADTDAVSWTATEFVDHNKNFGWYALLIVAAVIVAALIFLITKDKISSSVVVLAAIALAVFAARKPRTLEYRLDDRGVTVGPKFYDYDQFMSFSIVDEGTVPSIYLLPLKRFMPPLTLYYAHADEDAIVSVLGDRLPAQEKRVDSVDRFMHRIRF